MSNITSLDSDTKVFNEIWNAVKQDKYDSSSAQNSLDSDNKVFQVLNKSLSSDEMMSLRSLPIQSQTIPEESPLGSVSSFSMPEAPGGSPVYYPGGQVSLTAQQPAVDQVGEKLAKMDTVDSEQSKISLREHCQIRDGTCSCEVIIFNQN